VIVDDRGAARAVSGLVVADDLVEGGLAVGEWNTIVFALAAVATAPTGATAPRGGGMS
jgi:hypothetical protein